MDFEEFEKRIWEKGFGIAAMNHYSINGKRMLYCIIYNTQKGKAFMQEGDISSDVFEKLYGRVDSENL
ncbi:hypothetical protein JXC34_03545 [Candidatus Woesearchaeota archaeon]|nr:hypothetical protein [Candidatus Woesearchaeota archaeon]